MNRDEFQKWLKDYLAMFPATKEWLAKATGGGEQMGTTLKGWQKTLSMTPYKYACAVTDRIVKGDLPPVEAFNRDQTALIVRRHASTMRHADREDRVRRERAQLARSQNRWEAQEFSRRYRFGIGHVYREYLKLLQARDPEAARKMRAMADEPPADGQQGHGPADGHEELFT